MRPQAIKPKEALSYSVESSGTDSAVPQPFWKAALELPVFFVVILSLNRKLLHIEVYCKGTTRISFPQEGTFW